MLAPRPVRAAATAVSVVLFNGHLQPAINSECLDDRYRLAIDTGSATVTTDHLPADRKYIGAPHLVAQRIKPQARSFLRFA